MLTVMQTPPTPRLSIVIATWNAAKTIERCITSITNQSFTSWELLIKDGGSTDDTVAIIKRYEEAITWWDSSPDSGIYDAWNHALAHASGEYVCFLGADDLLADCDVLSDVSRAIDPARPHIVAGKGQMIDGRGRLGGKIGAAWNYRKLRRRIGICHPGTWFLRETFKKYGLFDTRYRIVADYAWLLRLPRSTSSFFVDRVIVIVGAGGVSRTQILRRLREHRKAQSECPRIGSVRAYIYWVDKLWRWPIARLFGLNY